MEERERERETERERQREIDRKRGKILTNDDTNLFQPKQKHT